ncbi:MAG: hypothetical protein KJ737_27790 [Proteobacteria bacterium]|nr:hypothetical protein [Pseudomonadota bacterium]
MKTENQNNTLQPEEKEIFTVPNLVSIEFIAMIVAMIILTIWSVSLDAPLKAIADPNWTENPAKAPWYFVGLQEVLVYFDPWIAGVSIPILIIVGLALIPYLDPNPKGVGEYNFRDRKLVITVFLTGYFLWFLLIVIGQYFRGPNWQFYWIWEDWAVHKEADQALVSIPNLFGSLILVAYFGLGTFISKIKFKALYEKMGTLKYVTSSVFTLMMIGILLKIVLRIFFHVKYIISTPYFSI